MFHQHIDSQIAKKPGNALEISSGLVEKSGKMLQARFQRLGSGFKGFGQPDADDGQEKGWLRLMHLDPDELVTKRADDPAQHGRIDIACRWR